MTNRPCGRSFAPPWRRAASRSRKSRPATRPRFRARSFDLVLLDINMPGPGGVETCQRIRALVPQIGILMVTVRDDEEDKVRALEAGADDYVTKPFRLRELVARMGAVLRRIDPQKSAEPGVLQAGSLKMDADRRLLWKGRRRSSPLPQGVRPTGLPDEESRRSADAHPAPARCLGTRIWRRTRIFTILSFECCARSWKTIPPGRSTY